MTPDEKLHALSEPHQRVYAALYQAAFCGLFCPSNKELAAIGGVSDYPRWGSDAIAILVKAGMIRVEVGLNTRVVILASGQSTAGKITVGRAVRVVQPHNAREPKIEAVARERTTCVNCGANSEHGCEHTRRAERAEQQVLEDIAFRVAAASASRESLRVH